MRRYVLALIVALDLIWLIEEIARDQAKHEVADLHLDLVSNPPCGCADKEPG